jgi:hypothetical protein
MIEDGQPPERIGDDDLPMQRGVIDSLEEHWALVALDDGQRLDWPRDRLPCDAREGMVVELSLHGPCALGALSGHGTWRGVVEALEGNCCPQTAVRLGSQRLRWPGAEYFGSQGSVIAHMQVDPEATNKRRKQVEDLVSDLFGEG